MCICKLVDHFLVLVLYIKDHDGFVQSSWDDKLAVVRYLDSVDSAYISVLDWRLKRIEAYLYVNLPWSYTALVLAEDQVVGW